MITKLVPFQGSRLSSSHFHGPLIARSLSYCGTIGALAIGMAFRNPLFIVGLSVIALMAGDCTAQVISKSDALAALDEPSPDMNRFERIAAIARSLGVSEGRITIARFSQLLFVGDIDGARKQFPETEKALTALSADEAKVDVSEIRQLVPVMKKVLESNDTNRVKMVIDKSRKGIEAKTILFDLRQIDSAVDQCAIEQGLKIGSQVPAREWIKKIRAGSRLRETGSDIFGVPYGDQVVDKAPKPNPASLEKVAAHVPPNYFDLKAK